MNVGTKEASKLSPLVNEFVPKNHSQTPNRDNTLNNQPIKPSSTLPRNQEHNYNRHGADGIPRQSAKVTIDNWSENDGRRPNSSTNWRRNDFRSDDRISSRCTIEKPSNTQIPGSRNRDFAQIVKISNEVQTKRMTSPETQQVPLKNTNELVSLDSDKSLARNDLQIEGDEDDGSWIEVKSKHRRDDRDKACQKSSSDRGVSLGNSERQHSHKVEMSTKNTASVRTRDAARQRFAKPTTSDANRETRDSFKGENVIKRMSAADDREGDVNKYKTRQKQTKSVTQNAKGENQGISEGLLSKKVTKVREKEVNKHRPNISTSRKPKEPAEAINKDVSDSNRDSIEGVNAIKKKKRKTNADKRADYQNKLKRLPLTRGKVVTVSSDLFQFINKGEPVPKILSRKQVVEEQPDLRQEDFPVLGQATVANVNDECDSGWSDVETVETVANVTTAVHRVDEFPELSAYMASMTPTEPYKRNYSELFKTVAFVRSGESKEAAEKAKRGSKVKKSKEAKAATSTRDSIAAPTSSKPKFNSLITMDLMNILSTRQKESNKFKQTVSSKEKKMVKIKPVVANILDSSAPARRRGKERETPRKKHPTTMKKIILKSRRERLLARSLLLSAAPNENIENCEPVVNAAETAVDVIEDGSDVKIATLMTEEAAVCISSPSEEPQNVYVNPEPKAIEEAIAVSETVGSCSSNASVLSGGKKHSRKFREYCHQNLSPEIDDVATKLIQDLIRFHDKVYQKDPVKAKMRRRMVYGLKEITKHLKLKRIKCLILAPNLERISNEGGLDDAVSSLVSLAKEQNVPVVFALGRRKLGYVCLKKVPVSAVGIFNYDGSEANFKRLVELAVEEQNAYAGIGNESADVTIAGELPAN